jgi:DNA segregation ATPase FtsK/SpoIIIE, S-DNA-T family
MSGKKSPDPTLISDHTLTRDFLGIGTAGFALFALISMISYSPHDPSFHQFSSQGNEIQNYGGLVGSYLADGLVRVFGTGAFAFPLVALLVGWAVIRGQEFRRWPVVLFFGSIFLVTLCSLLALQFAHDPFFGKDVETGGMVGAYISQGLVLWLSVVGAHLVLILIMFVALLAMSGVPANKLFQTTGLAFVVLFRWGLKSIRAVGTLLVQIVGEFKDWLWETVHIWKSARKEKSKYRKLSEPVIVSRELLSPSPKTLDGFPETREKEQEKKPEKKEEFAVQGNFPFANETGEYQLPPVSLLNDPPEVRNVGKMREELMLNSTILEKKLSDFGVEGRVVQVLPGPVITLYEFEPAPGIKVSRILSLTDDLALAMRAPSVRILAPVPGKSVVGIELPNPKRETVSFKEVICSESFQETHSKVALAVGKDHIGRPVTEDLAQIPHLLMAGSTGSGKSVGINTMICSLLINTTPEEVKMIMIDPKMLELNMYDGIPHLIAPVVTNPKKAAAALQWAVSEMERRYKLMADNSVRNISGFNQMVDKILHESDRKKKSKNAKNKRIAEMDENSENIDPEVQKAELDISTKLPYIVIIIDELADLMMVACKGVEDSLTRLAQMARAAGIHLIVATQRPSVDVLTGIIKANFPARISYQVTSRVDSRTILDCTGAEKLLGKGDMLFLPPGTSKIHRIHGAMVSDEEINRILEFIKGQEKKPEYEKDVFEQVVEATREKEDEDEFDEKYDEAVALVARERQASISMIQRKLRVGYNRAARMVEIMEREGVVGPSDGIRPRDVYAKPIPFETLD